MIRLSSAARPLGPPTVQAAGVDQPSSCAAEKPRETSKSRWFYLFGNPFSVVNPKP